MGCCSSSEADVDFDEEVNFDHFRVLRSIGRGAFGKVCIVERRDTHAQYAMKYVNKKHCIESKSGENTLREQDILAELDGSCPFIVNLWYTFQDPEDLFFVVDYMAGGDLAFHLRQATFDEDRTRLYVSEIALALSYLHKNNIIHRDIKPENVLLDSEGHVRITDFNVAFKYSTNGNSKPRAIAGTRPYMAPEMLVGQGRSPYTVAVDWWSLGISMYEILVGKVPYYVPSTQSEAEIRDFFKGSKLQYPTFLSSDCCYAVQQLLRMTVSRRVSSVDKLLALDFFRDLDMHAVGKKEVTPSFVPQSNLMNCDPMHELEEMIVEPQPLHKKKKRMKKLHDEEDNVPADFRNLTDKFYIFDRLKGGRQSGPSALDLQPKCGSTLSDAGTTSVHSVSRMASSNSHALEIGSVTSEVHPLADDRAVTMPLCTENEAVVDTVAVDEASGEMLVDTTTSDLAPGDETKSLSSPTPDTGVHAAGTRQSTAHSQLVITGPAADKATGSTSSCTERALPADCTSQTLGTAESLIAVPTTTNPVVSQSESSMIPLVDASEFNGVKGGSHAQSSPQSLVTNCSDALSPNARPLPSSKISEKCADASDVTLAKDDQSSHDHSATDSIVQSTEVSKVAGSDLPLEDSSSEIPAQSATVSAPEANSVDVAPDATATAPAPEAETVDAAPDATATDAKETEPSSMGENIAEVNTDTGCPAVSHDAGNSTVSDAVEKAPGDGGDGEARQSSV